ncbi:conserved hypothetical protein [uncultured Eubacteriales bacterium]|uniref:Protein CotJB domain-containing protein n=1 Tax=uncultured Eubacteriales bacterium TaxID=172733 RepID=A0A212JUR8_9FIRM|nr:conserved hypothetical protein [uncultured Eubacteriales bacterium]
MILETGNKENVLNFETSKKENVLNLETGKKENVLNLETGKKENALNLETGKKENVLGLETSQKEMPLCDDASGTLPECAPLAVPYVPFQQTGSRRYSRQEALNNGTLFPGLNLPFHVKAEARDVASGHLAELQALEFVLLELALYLDTHQNDSEAFELYRKYAAMEKEARERYEAMYGPVMHRSVVNEKSWAAWLNDPWPWNYTGRKEG